MNTDYNEKVMEHFMNPKNSGEIKNPSAVGEVGNPACGDMMKIFLDIDENGIIKDIKFKTFGCGAAIATSSIATEMVKGKHISEAREVTNKAIVEALGGLPKQKIHCSVLAADAIKKALDEYEGIEHNEEENAVICDCLGIDTETITEAVEHGAFSIEEVAEKTGATTGACKGERCREKIQKIIDKYV
ncbi:MAG: Fe-S cluster assembly scaffold protein NifU [Candidatus Muiribacteriota bacterium]